jgi:hypothetical protein
MGIGQAPPAPELKYGLCSDCRVAAVPAAGGDMKICPRCHAVLWHRDYGAELARQKRAAAEAAVTRERERRAAKEAAKKAAHQIVGEPEPPTET